jgi:hypothetical protein
MPRSIRIMANKRYDRLHDAYTFLMEHSANGLAFTRTEMAAATSWAPSTVRTYANKQWSTFLTPKSGGYIVNAEFARLSETDFQELCSQKRAAFSKYTRVRYSEVVSYEFLLPLSKERELRRALDDLFYEDGLRQRLREITLPLAASWIPRLIGESDEAFTARAAGTIGDLFGGYSISHVDGRFRIGNLTDRIGAAQLLISHGRYLIDETTASVRFIIPVLSSLEAMESFTGLPSEFTPSLIAPLEIQRIHDLFFALFVETVVSTVHEEEEIWLIEETPRRKNLYVWKRSP